MIYIISLSGSCPVIFMRLDRSHSRLNGYKKISKADMTEIEHD